MCPVGRGANLLADAIVTTGQLIALLSVSILVFRFLDDDITCNHKVPPNRQKKHSNIALLTFRVQQLKKFD